MSGNVYEWVDSCDGVSGALDTCYMRSGSFNNPPSDAESCVYARPNTRKGSTVLIDDVGFCCCVP